MGNIKLTLDSRVTHERSTFISTNYVTVVATKAMSSTVATTPSQSITVAGTSSRNAVDPNTSTNGIVTKRDHKGDQPSRHLWSPPDYPANYPWGPDHKPYWYETHHVPLRPTKPGKVGTIGDRVAMKKWKELLASPSPWAESICNCIQGPTITTTYEGPTVTVPVVTSYATTWTTFSQGMGSIWIPTWQTLTITKEEDVTTKGNATAMISSNLSQAFNTSRA